RHGEWLEDPLISKVAKRLTTDALHDDAEQGETGIAINILGARLEVERGLPGHDIEDIGFSNAILLEPAAWKGEQWPLIAQPAGVGEQMSKGDWCPVIGNLRYVF